jgi:hypothetical protein
VANIRVAQQLSQGYNPDGTPGTVSTGVPGPGPSSAQIAAAVSDYLMANPIDVSMGVMGIDTAPLTKHGLGADGSTGAWVGVGDNGSTVSGYVVAGGSLPDVDLHLAAKGNGQLYLDNSVGGDVVFSGNVSIGNQAYGTPGYNQVLSAPAINVGDYSFVYGPESMIARARVGNSYFGVDQTGGWLITDEWVQIAPWGPGHGFGQDGVQIVEPSSGNYLPIRASAFTVSSDRRLKSDIEPLVGALEEVRTTPAYSYLMGGERRRGLIADEAPGSIVRTDERGYQLIESYDLVGTLWAAVRELADKIKGMESTCRCPQTR